MGSRCKNAACPPADRAWVAWRNSTLKNSLLGCSVAPSDSPPNVRVNRQLLTTPISLVDKAVVANAPVAEGRASKGRAAAWESFITQSAIRQFRVELEGCSQTWCFVG